MGSARLHLQWPSRCIAGMLSAESESAPPHPSDSDCEPCLLHTTISYPKPSLPGMALPGFRTVFARLPCPWRRPRETRAVTSSRRQDLKAEVLQAVNDSERHELERVLDKYVAKCERLQGEAEDKTAQLVEAKALQASYLSQRAKAEQACGDLSSRCRELQRHAGDLRNELSRAKVLHATCLGEKKEAEEERGKYRRLYQEAREAGSAALLTAGGGVNIQGAFPNVPEVQAEVQRTLTNTVGSFIDALLDHPGGHMFQTEEGVIPDVLVDLFNGCWHEIEACRQARVELLLAFLGLPVTVGTDTGGPQHEPDSEVAMSPRAWAFMLDHLRAHHTRLFPVQGDGLSQMCAYAGGKLSARAADTFWKLRAQGHQPRPGLGDADAAARQAQTVLRESGLDKVLEAYLRLFVHCALQQPPLAFTGDVGQRQPFDRRAHEPPIDGGRGEQCVVVFPAVTRPGGAGPPGSGTEHERITKRYVLAVGS